MSPSRGTLAALLLGAWGIWACAARPATSPPAPAGTAPPDTGTRSPAASEPKPAPRPVVAPQVAYLAGLMPLRSTGVETFRQRYPQFDGRGVLIAVLDGGLDPAAQGLQTTTTGERKILDLRDFSGEGRIPLRLVVPSGEDAIRVGGHQLTGLGRLVRLALPPYYGGLLREPSLGSGPGADANGDGDQEDEFPLLVARASDGWVLVADTDGDGSLADERPIRDYAASGDVLAFGAGPLSFAANLTEQDGRPVLDLVFDNSSHGTHVAGIAAGHALYGLDGFDGVAPGAQLLGLKIADNGWGKISVSTSMVRALEYAATYAARLDRPLVVNLSYGVGNEREGSAVIDSLLDRFAEQHPEVLVVVSAGNDGPGISTVGAPASADLVLSVCALVPGVFSRAPDPETAPAPDLLGWWSARGGELAKPDLCAPGVAFSTVPRWRSGEEIAGGTSQAAPHIAGLAALLQSAARQQGRRLRAIDLERALAATAQPLPGATVLDQGWGVPNVLAAYQWLGAAHQAGIYRVRALADGGNRSRASAAYRRDGLLAAGDTVQRFLVWTVGGQPAARLLLRPDVSWLRSPRTLELAGQPVTVTLTYDAGQLRAPGLYVGNVWAWAASDTLAGASFRLTNTVVVPYEMDRPVRASRTLAAGGTDRYFLRVPPEAGGLALALRVHSGRSAKLYLFDPAGRPHPSAGLEVGPRDSLARLAVPAHDLEPGVYEAAIVASPAEATAYEFTAELPPVAVQAIGSGPSAVLVNTSGDSLEARVRAAVVGAAKDYRVGGTAEVAAVELPVPAWAGQVVLDFSVPDTLWSRITDIGFRARDAQGRELDQRPLDYALGRRILSLDGRRIQGPLRFELRPAFAREVRSERWEIALRVTWVARDPMPLALPRLAAAPWLVLAPAERLGLTFSPLPAEVPVPEGWQPVLEVTVEPRRGVPASRRGVLAPLEGRS